MNITWWRDMDDVLDFGTRGRVARPVIVGCRHDVTLASFPQQRVIR